MPVNFVSTRIVASDVPALAEFYGAISCVSPVFGSPEFAEIRTASGTVAISSQRSSDRNGAGAATPRSNRSVVIEFMVDDVDAERARLSPLVTDWVLEPTNQPWGNRSMLFRDPEGNLINFYKPLPRAAA
jgi:uncharacterized glyoxalase superfamily protein PhnB